MSIWALYLLLLQATVLSFSGFGSVPLVREDLVIERGVLSDQQLNDAIAISQASPGPLGLYVVIVGYFVAGVPGAIAGVLALASPAILAVPVAAAVRRGRAAEIRGACSAIVIVSCVLMLKAANGFAPEAAPSLAFVAIAVCAFSVLALTRVPPLFVIVASALAGLLVR
jgi:chromate transporter